MLVNKLFYPLNITSNVVRCFKTSAQKLASKPPLELPKPGYGKSYRRIVHYPEKYTVKPLDVTNLAGRDPVSGRVIVKGIGGGIKHKYHWINWHRTGPTEGPPQEEKVIQILKDGCRSAHIALVAVGSELKYILATENMKPGDVLKTSRELFRIPVQANEGDAYILGSLPNGTMVHSIEKEPGRGSLYVHSAGTYATILRKEKDRVILQMPSKKLFNFDQHCMAVVGRLSNIEHASTPIGSAQANRWLGNRPRSGLWQRKSGRHGRKIKPPKPPKIIAKNFKAPTPIQLTMDFHWSSAKLPL